MSSAADFKFGEATEGAAPRTVTQVAPVVPYVVGYIDNEGKEQTRIAFRVPGAKTSYILRDRIERTPTVVPAHSWFHKAFIDKLQSTGLEESSGEQVDAL
jgi:hypothetical protein